jgi:integrase
MHLPLRKPNSAYRSREHLYEHEVKAILKAARMTPRTKLRNEAIILVGIERSLRPCEIINLKWQDVCFENNTIRINRVKNGISGDHIIRDREVLLLKRLYKARNLKGRQSIKVMNSPYVFSTLHGTKMSCWALIEIVRKIGVLAGLPFRLHPHMFRHTWNERARLNKVNPLDMKAHNGHRNIASTMKYILNHGNSELPSMFS